jgi:glycogen operon protein
VVDASFYVMFNANHETVEFRLPDEQWGRRWTEVLRTNECADQMSEDVAGHEYPASGSVRLEASSLVLLRRMT